MKLNDSLDSILNDGSSSKHLNDFFITCKKMAFAYLTTKKNIRVSLELSKKIGCNLDDLACDSIAELFQNNNGKFIQIDSYFVHLNGTLRKMDQDELTAYLSVLIRSKVNQYLTTIKGDVGDIFIKVRKAVRIYLERNPKKFRMLEHNRKIFVVNSSIKEPDFNLPLISNNEIMDEIFFTDVKNYFVSEIVNSVFCIIKSRDDRCEAIPLDNLYSVVKSYYDKRLYDYQN